MSNPTSNFGWQMPTPTDLVTDLPADFEVFGQAVDTSLADLRGGTTGQVLSKTTNADMDFTWVASNPGDITEVTVSSPITGGGSSGSVNVAIQDGTTAQKGAVQLENSTASTSTTTAAVPASVKSAYDLANGAIAKSIVDAKGDLILGTANDTVSRLAVGATNGYLLTVDSAEATGVKWAAAPSAGMTFSTWTPSWTRLTVGNGTVIARYGESGKFIFVDISLQFGSTTSITGNSPEFTLPVNAKVTDRPPGYGYDMAIALDYGEQIYYISVGEGDATSREFWGSPAGARSLLTSTSPFTFATNDCLLAHFVYEAA